MKEKFKKIGIISLIVLIVLVCLIFLCFAYLFLVPNSHLFGIKYLNDNSGKYYYIDGVSEAGGLSQVVVDTNRYSIDVTVEEVGEGVKIYVKNDLSGFCKKRESVTELKYSYNKSQTKLVVETDEATGWLGFGSSYIQLCIPKQVLTSNAVLNIETHRKSSININGAGCEFGLIRVAGGEGKTEIDNLKTGSLEICSYGGSVKIGKNVQDISNLSVDVGSADIDFLEAGGGLAEINNAKKENREIDFDIIDFNIEEIKIVNMSKNSHLKIVKCGKLQSVGGSANYISGGEISCLKIEGGINFYSRNCNLSVDYLSGNKSYFKSNGSGKLVSRVSAGAELDVETNSGAIELNEVTQVSSLITNSGKITIKKALEKMQVNSNSGDVNILFGDGVRQISLLNVGSGKVRIDGVETVTKMVVGGKADIFINYEQVVGDSDIEAGNSKIKICVPFEIPVYFYVEADKAMFSCCVGTLNVPMGEFTGTYNKSAWSETGSGDGIEISTSGTLMLYDTESITY